MEKRSKEDLDRLSRQIVNAAFSVHSELGPGLLEGIYHQCLIKELELRGLSYGTQIAIPIVYKGCELEKCYQLDLLVEGEVIIELKSVEALHPVHEAQLLTYLKITGKRLGFLFNFNVPLMKQGIKRMVNRF